MANFDEIEKTAEKKYAQKDKRKRPRMHMSGKGVFQLQNLIRNAHNRLSQKKKRKK